MRNVFGLLAMGLIFAVTLSMGRAQEEKKTTTQTKEKKPVVAESTAEKKTATAEKATEKKVAADPVKEKKPAAGTPTKTAGSQTAGDAVKKSEVPQVTEGKPLSFWMEKKLDYSKSILESLTKGDFKQVAVDAEQMRLLGKIEGFVRRKNESYRGQHASFDAASQELIRQSKRENAEGATLAFNQLTSSCVACHVLLREDAKETK
jgi:hypothetical protein